MERVKVNKSNNWVRAKSQSSKTNRFKVLNEKYNRIRGPDIQRKQHFTVLDPVNHLVGSPTVQVQEGGRRGGDAVLWVRTPFIERFFFNLFVTIMAEQILWSKTNANVFAAEYISARLQCRLFQNRKQAIWLCRLTIIKWLALKTVWTAFDSGNESHGAVPVCHFLLRTARLLAVCSSRKYWMSGPQQHLSCWQGSKHDFIKGITSRADAHWVSSFQFFISPSYWYSDCWAESNS